MIDHRGKMTVLPINFESSGNDEFSQGFGLEEFGPQYILLINYYIILCQKIKSEIKEAPDGTLEQGESLKIKKKAW